MNSAEKQSEREDDILKEVESISEGKPWLVGHEYKVDIREIKRPSSVSYKAVIMWFDQELFSWRTSHQADDFQIPLSRPDRMHLEDREYGSVKLAEMAIEETIDIINKTLMQRYEKKIINERVIKTIRP